MSQEPPNFVSKVIQVIKKIPSGRVTNYGTVAALAGNPRGAREVGYILHSFTKKHNLPWQRVVDRNGYISIRGEQVDAKMLQKNLLEEEGVEVSKDFMIDLDKYGWFGENSLDSRKLEVE
jgi:methylated-DNA-protein-cysteine methyltransferase related protein